MLAQRALAAHAPDYGAFANFQFFQRHRSVSFSPYISIFLLYWIAWLLVKAYLSAAAKFLPWKKQEKSRKAGWLAAFGVP